MLRRLNYRDSSPTAQNDKHKNQHTTTGACGLEGDADGFVDGFEGDEVGEAIFAGSGGGAVVEDAVGEVVGLAGELRGVLLGAGDVDFDPGCAMLTGGRRSGR